LNHLMVRALNDYSGANKKTFNGAVIAACKAYGVTGRSFNTLVYKALYKDLSVVPPVNTAAPVISRPPSVGQTLTCSTGSWSQTIDEFSFQWYRDGIVISGATGNSYVLVTADAGKLMSCRVTASNLSGTANA